VLPAVKHSDVFLEQLEVMDPESILGQPDLLQIRLPCLDGDNLGSSSSKLDCEKSLQRSQVENAHAFDGCARQIDDELQHASQARLVTTCDARLDRVDVVVKLHVVCGPCPEARLDLTLPFFDLGFIQLVLQLGPIWAVIVSSVVSGVG
jgi:hypothetical protein